MKKNEMKFYYLWILIFNLFVSVYFASSVHAINNAYAIQNASVGEKALDFSLSNLKGGSVAITDYQGKNTVAVCFWNLTSKDSVKELDVLAQLYSWYNKENGLEVLAVYTPPEPRDVNETEIAEINKLLEEKKYPFLILLDQKQTVYKLYGVVSFPSFMIISKEGKIDYLMPMWSPLKGEDNVKDNVKKALGIEIAAVHESKQMSIKRTFKPNKDAAMEMNMAEKFLKDGEFDSAVIKLKKSAEADANYVKPHIMLANIYDKQGNMAEALVEYSAAISINPDEVQPHIDYGFFNLKKNMPDDAFAEFKKALELDPASGDSHYGLGAVYRKQGKKEDAKAEFKKTISLFADVGKDLFAGMKKKREVHPNLANAYNDLGEILLEEGNKEEALVELKKASDEYRGIIEKLQKRTK
ncbi:MAG: tetratricopeptide repeat protein [bacterium]|nr:tetratricopeptide repeat protein [bacterium]